MEEKGVMGLGHLLRIRHLISAIVQRTGFVPSPRVQERLGTHFARALSIAKTLRERSVEIGGVAGILMLAVAENIEDWMATVVAGGVGTLPAEVEVEIKNLLAAKKRMALGYLEYLEKENV